MPGIDFSLLKTPDFVGNALQAYETGDKLRTRKQTRNALAMYGTDPEGAVNALLPIDPEKATALQQFSTGQKKQRARDAAAPMIQAGQFSAAAQAVAKDDPDFAQSLFKMDKDALDHAQRVGETGAKVLLSSLQLKSPDERRAFALSHSKEIEALGFPTDRIQQFPWENDGQIRAAAGRFQGIEQLAGTVKAQQFGDNVYSVRTGPNEATVDTKPLLKVPATRAEGVAAQRANQDRTDSDRRYSLDRDRVDIERGKADEVSFGNVVGTIAQKLSQGQDLSPGEREVWDTYKTQKQDPYMAALMGGAGQPAAPPQAGPQAPAAKPQAPAGPQARGGGGQGSQANPFRPKTPDEASRLPKGAYFYTADGRLMQRK